MNNELVDPLLTGLHNFLLLSKFSETKIAYDN
jgi:hypothetical protein